MNANYLSVTGWDLAIATVLVIVAGGVSLALRLSLERRLALAALRTVIQLLLVGYILRWIFARNVPWIVLIAMAVMLAAASQAAVARSSRTFRGAAPRAFVTLVLSAVTTTFVVTALVLQVEPWYAPRYLIPLLGMILGNGLTGVSLCMDRMLSTLVEQRHVVEMELAHGASRWEASREVLRDGVRNGMVPIINSMMVVGVVSLPGMMTGQILAGAEPVEAVKYQIVVMFMIASATSLGCMLIAGLIYRRVLNAKHQLVLAGVRKRES